MPIDTSGFEHYFQELEQLIAQGRPSDPSAIAEVRYRYDTSDLAK
jgi:hypothetical protein